jgi:TolB-like protein
MSFFSELRKRRVVPWIGAFIAGGFIALEATDQLIGYDMLPVVAYQVVLVFYLFGIPGTMVLAWFHGERGAQTPPKAEVWLHASLLVGAIAVSTVLVRNYEGEGPRVDVLAAAGLDSDRLAVLYFEDFTADDEMAFLADGLTEALIDELARVRALDVVSANGVEPFRERQISPDSIARALGVAHLVDGSVERVGGELRITTRLVEGLSGTDIDRTSFRIPEDEILSAQDSVVQSVSRALRRRLGDEIQLRERQASTGVAEAWALVQRAEQLARSANEAALAGSLDGALAELREAEGLLALAQTADPRWAEPPTQRSFVYFQLARLTVDAGDIAGADSLIESGIGHADHALAIANAQAAALEYRGRHRYLRWLLDLAADRDEADRLLADARADLESAVRLQPTLASAHSALSHLYNQTGDLVGVLLAARRAYEEDAYLADADAILQRLFWGSYDLEQIPEARQWCEEGARRFPDDHRFAECELWLMLVPGVEPDVERAWSAAEEVQQLAPPDMAAFETALTYTIVGGVIGRAGMPDSANAVFDRSRVGPEVDPTDELRGFEAASRAAMGDLDGAMELLRRYVAGHAQHSFTVGTSLHWWWRPLRDHPGFQSIVR